MTILVKVLLPLEIQMKDNLLQVIVAQFMSEHLKNNQI